MRHDASVIVAGAGVAGLAARALSHSGRKVLLLEARPRIGGRVSTVRDPLLRLPLELGAEFVHGLPPESWDVIRSAGLAPTEVTGREWRVNDGFWREPDGEGEPAAILHGMRTAPEQSFAEYVANCPAGRETKEQTSAYVEGFNAARLDQVGLRWPEASECALDAIEGDRLVRLPGGYDAVPLALWRGVLPGNVELRLDTVAHSIEWRPRTCRDCAHSSAGYSRGVFSAPQAVVALPLGVLKRSGIRISPVPDSWRANLALLEMGEVVRVLLAFRQPFWEAREEGRELSFLHSLQAAIPTWWTARPAEVPVLTGWAGGARATPLLADGESHVVRCALESLSFIFDRPVDDLRDLLASWRLHDWTADPFSCGAYSFGLPGAAKAGGKLAEPIESTLFMAGEHTADGHAGTVHGAIASGERVARLVMNA